MVSTVLLVLTIFFLQANSESRSIENDSEDLREEKEEYKHWSISELSDSLSSSHSNQLVFMGENSMIGTYLELKKGESFNRAAVTDDIYYLYSGSCAATISGTDQPFSEGDVVFVKKGADFKIEGTSQNLQFVIISMTLDFDAERPSWKHFSKHKIESLRDPEENSWNPFIMYSNVMLGMYTLPYEVDGDNRLVHEWQELNIITAGSSKFEMDTGSIDVEEGSIFFVEEGNGHYFDALEEDIDILILWEQRNVSHEGH